MTNSLRKIYSSAQKVSQTIRKIDSFTSIIAKLFSLRPNGSNFTENFL